MPELPEVETLKKGLISKVNGKRIVKVDIIKYKKADCRIKKLGLANVRGVRRRAKLLIIDLSNGYSMVIHVKLTGYFYFFGKGKVKLDKLTRVVFWFKDGSALLFEDVRKFGWIKVVKTSEVDKFLAKFRFGPELLSKEFTLGKFKEMLKKRGKSKIKPLLMDQKFIAGIGNIYAQEACYCAGILPMRKSGSLSDGEISRLYNCIIKILKKAIKKKGTSANDYVTVEGRKGSFASLLKVYQRDKDPKGHELTWVVMGSRGTNYCKVCQK